MQINGVELKFNYHEENTNRKMNEALKSMASDAEAASGLPEPEHIRILCSSIKNAFDYIFGSGTGEKVCGKENDMDICTDAITELAEERNRQEDLLREKSTRLAKALNGNAK